MEEIKYDYIHFNKPNVNRHVVTFCHLSEKVRSCNYICLNVGACDYARTFIAFIKGTDIMTKQKIPQQYLRFTIKTFNPDKRILSNISGNSYKQISFIKHWDIDKYSSQIVIQFIFECIDLVEIEGYSSSHLKEIYVNGLGTRGLEIYCENWIGGAI